MNYFAGKWRLYETARVCRRPTISYGSWWNPPPKSTRLVPTVTETKKAQCFSATPVVSLLMASLPIVVQCETECLYLFPVCWSSQKDCDHLLTLINKEIGLPLGQVTNLPMFYCNTCGKLMITFQICTSFVGKRGSVGTRQNSQSVLILCTS